MDAFQWLHADCFSALPADNGKSEAWLRLKAIHMQTREPLKRPEAALTKYN